MVNKLFCLGFKSCCGFLVLFYFKKSLPTTCLLYISITVNTIKNAESSSPAVSSLYEGQVLYSTLALF